MWPFKTKVIEEKPKLEEADVNAIVMGWRGRDVNVMLLLTIYNYTVRWNGNFFKNMNEDNRAWVFHKLIDYVNMREGQE